MIKNFLILNCIGKDNKIGLKVDNNFYTHDLINKINNSDKLVVTILNLVKKYDGEFPSRFSDEIFEYLSIDRKQFPIAYKKFEQELMTKEYFLYLADKFRSPHLWKEVNGKWELRNKIWD